MSYKATLNKSAAHISSLLVNHVPQDLSTGRANFGMLEWELAYKLFKVTQPMCLTSLLTLQELN